MLSRNARCRSAGVKAKGTRRRRNENAGGDEGPCNEIPSSAFRAFQCKRPRLTRAVRFAASNRRGYMFSKWAFRSAECSRGLIRRLSRRVSMRAIGRALNRNCIACTAPRREMCIRYEEADPRRCPVDIQVPRRSGNDNALAPPL